MFMPLLHTLLNLKAKASINFPEKLLKKRFGLSAESMVK